MGFNWGKTLSILILTAFLFSTFSPGILLAAEEADSKENIISTEPVSTPAIEEKSVQKESTGKAKITPIPTVAGTEKTTDPNLMTAAATSSTTTESPGPGEIKSPDSPLNSNAAYQTGLFTGSANYDYSIPVPPGTNGLTPEVKLSYNSMGASGRSTIVGLGWDLNLSYILRDVNYTPTNISDDKFKLVLNGSSHDLLYDVQSNSYKTKIDSGLMIKKLGGAPNRYNEYWEVKSKDGTTYRLGYNMNAESKCESVTNPRAWGVRNYSKAWYLDEITDINNNKVYYTYQYNIDLSDIGAVYIQKIEYNNEKSRKIEFVYEDSTRFDSGFYYEQGACRVSQNRRLDKIKTFVNNTLKNTYDFDFTNTNTSKSLLKQVTQQSAEGLDLPATKFDYNLLQSGFVETNQKKLTYTGFQFPREWVVNGRVYNQVRTLDLNRDFLPDIVKSVGDHNNTPVTSRNWEVYLNNGSGWNNKQIWAQYGIPSLDDGTKSYTSGDVLVGLSDMNLDGLEDIYVVDNATSFKKTSVNGIWYYLNNGTSFAQTPLKITSPNTLNTFVNDLNYIDFNTDGLTDVKNGGCFNNGTDCGVYFYQPGQYGAQQNINPGTQMDFNLVTKFVNDVNGDGVPDLINTSGSNWYVYLGNGLGWDDQQLWNNNVTRNAGCVETCNLQPYLLDMDGDGFVDLVEIKYIPFSGGDYELRIHKNTGYSWESGYTIWHSGGNEGNYAATQLKNYDHDSLPEMRIKSDDSVNGGYIDVIKNPNHAPLLLNKITTPLGGTTEIEYTPSTKYDNTGGDGISDLGFPVWTVSKITENDGMGSSDATTFAYKNGMQDYQDREFRGFGQVTTTNSEGTVTEHYFHQDDALKGNEYKTIIKDQAGKPYQENRNTWSSIQTGAVYTNRLITTDSFSYDGIAVNPKQTRITYEYDSYGNVTLEKNWGDFALVGDELSTSTSFVYNTIKWIVDKPKNIKLLDSSNNKIKESWIFYDASTDNNAIPQKGLVTKEEQWNNTGSNIITGYEYNSFGNVTRQVDSLNRATVFGYDSTNTFQTTITNPKNHILTITYDPATGNKLTETDPNGYVKTNIYDGFGRIVKEVLPYDSTIYPTTMYEYTLTGNAPAVVKVMKRENTAQTGTIDAYTILDGFGRVIQTRTEAEDVTKQIATGFSYNGFGKVEKQILPQLVNTGIGYTVLPSGSKAVDLVFDPLGRVVDITNPDNTKQGFKYDHWKLTLSDANNHRRVQYLNAYNQITQIDENKSGVVYTTRYEYQFPGGNVTKITDSKGSQIRFEYDSLGRNTKLTDHSIGTWVYTYDAVGNMLSQTDNRGVTVNTVYDVLNRPVLINYPTDTDIQFVYDREKVGTISEISDATGTTKYSYDNRLRTIKEEKAIVIAQNITNGTPSINKTFITENTYDSADRIVAIKYPVIAGQTQPETLNYSFNTQGQIETVGGILANINYNALNKIVRKEYANNINTNYVYNQTTERLEEINTAKSGAGALQNFKYTYDNVGNITTISDVIKATTQRFSYDDLDRLITASEPGAYDYTYDYDSVGNILKVTTQDGEINYYYEDSARPNILTKIINSGSGGCERFNAEYFTNQTLSGTPVHSACETEINYDWDWGEINPYVGSNNASVRWTGTFDFDNAEYTFQTTSDDGIKLYIDGQIVIDEWRPQAAINASYKKVMSAGVHEIKVEYFEDGGPAVIKAFWKKSSEIQPGNTNPALHCPGIADNKFCAEYFTNNYLSGTSEVKRVEDAVNYDWGGNAPSGFSKSDYFSVRWNGNFSFNEGMYTFNASPDDGIRLWVDGELLVNEWYNHWAVTHTADKYMSAGLHNIVVEYYEHNGGAVAQVNWAQAQQVQSLRTVEISQNYDLSGTGSAISDSELLESTESISIKPGKIKPAVTVTPVLTITPKAAPSPEVVEESSLRSAALISEPESEPMQLMAVESMGIQSNGDTEYTYNGNGNLISDNEFCYTYNDANKISIVKTCTDNKLVSEYIYDSAGQRVIKKTFNNGTFDKLAVDVSDLYDLTVKADGTEESNIYYRANNELIAKKDNTGKITYHHNDHLGSASIVTDTQGAIVEETRYYPYGGVREGGSELTGKYTYTGQESDNETGLMYYGARYYAAEIGRFVQPDSMLPDIYDVQQLNRYVYVKNNPLKYTDPSGNCATGIMVDTMVCGVGAGASYVVVGGAVVVTIGMTGYVVSCIAIGCDETNENINRNATGIINAARGLVSTTGLYINLQVARFNTWRLFESGTDREKLLALTVVALAASGIDPDDIDNGKKQQNNTELNKSKRSLERQLNEHRQKLDKYKNDPYSSDNKSMLNANNTQNHQTIIKNRIEKLEGQIHEFERQIKEIDIILKNRK